MLLGCEFLERYINIFLELGMVLGKLALRELVQLVGFCPAVIYPNPVSRGRHPPRSPFDKIPGSSLNRN